MHFDFIQKIADEGGDCQDNYEKFISDKQSELHDNHWIITQARICILNGADFNTQDLPRIENLSSHCRSEGLIEIWTIYLQLHYYRKLIQMIDTLQLGNISMRGYIEYHLRSVDVRHRTQRNRSGEGQ